VKGFRNNNREDEKAQESRGTGSPEQPEIVSLVQKAVGGDFEAFGELYSIYLDRIYRYVLYQVRDKMMAEDLTEEVFYKAWKAIKSCKGREQTFSAWLNRIAHNHVIDGFRSGRNRLSIEMVTLAEVKDPSLEVEGKLGREELLKIITWLPKNQQQVIILKFLEGLDNQEIGQVMGKSQGAVRVLQMRALATLRQTMSREQ
jgi:RNA polymerase sigma-70 factor (ECF subfamily)